MHGVTVKFEKFQVYICHTKDRGPNAPLQS